MTRTIQIYAKDFASSKPTVIGNKYDYNVRFKTELSQPETH